uniref:RRM domain-containing protein n=1 Tax=Steinernema glaseri TaxID=37863 RepID=A0A1I7YDM2_9BILA
MFRKVQDASMILLDKAARAAYDHVVAAKAAKKAFFEQRRTTEDSKRRKFREELERREAAASGAKKEEADFDRDLEREIARLRKEGARLLAEENERLRRKMEEEEQNRRRQAAPPAHRPTASAAPPKKKQDSGKEKQQHTLKLKWKPSDDFNYDEGALQEIFGRYGKISLLFFINKKKKNSAVLEFENIASALEAENERGDKSCPIKVTWLTDRPDRAPSPPPPTPPPAPPSDPDDDDDDVVIEQVVNVPKGFAHGTTTEEFEAFEAAILAQMSGSSRKRAAPPDDIQIID